MTIETHNENCMRKAGLPFKPICTCEIDNPVLLSVPDGVLLWEAKMGMPWPVNQADASAREAQDMLCSALRTNVPDMDEESVKAHVDEYLLFLGKLLVMLEVETPTPAKGAAILTVAEWLKLETVSKENLSIMVSLMESVKLLRDKLGGKFKSDA
jgi:hypothetical protein